ncbi:two-component system regulatory protein YycI [Viridibacillus sp. YIM B01967]|uniref:Two-component system regulatory protein YycI n=1 Tax=Viridibacillus soli TaxID=2798301 RepID=A0ABS1HBH0_9BACL|nr:two-component system regulatory protein YycI [Viridibacillus soli]MBK3496792.1 two-component system regulatory protein YycI [Viridibacillus soli]
MDWSKTKTIFIIVFSILNVFLYSLYVNRYNEAQEVEPLAAETTIEARLNDENITVKSLPQKKEKVSYISGQIKQFNIEELKKVYDNQYFDTNGSLLTSKFENPVPLKSIKDASSLTEFMKKNVYAGETYKLWYIDEEKREATFFQKSNDRMIYINQNAVVKLHWDKDFAVTGYKQTMFDSLAAFGEKSTLLTALEAIKVLYEKGFLKQDSKITKPQLGYSTLVPLTKTQVLAPTWHIHVDFVEGDEADYFVNAVDGQVINIHLNGEELKDNEWGRIRS